MSKRRYDYKTCEYCGVNLDVGEKCDCQKNNPAERPYFGILGAEWYKNTSEYKNAEKRHLRGSQRI